MNLERESMPTMAASKGPAWARKGGGGGGGVEAIDW